MKLKATIPAAPQEEPSPAPGTEGRGVGSHDMQEAVIHVNFGLSWDKIRNALLGAGALIAAGITSGWLFLPAKDQDVQNLTRTVVNLMTTVEKLNTTMTQLQTTVDQLAKEPRLQVSPRPLAAPRRRQ